MCQIFKRVRVWIETGLFWVLSFRGSKADIKNTEETVKMICEGKSLIRFGDGEFGIFHNEDIHYQKWSSELRIKFENIKKDYIEKKEKSPYILAVPNSFMKCNGVKLMKKRVYVAAWSRARWDFLSKFPQKALIYGDAFAFEKKKRNIYSQIWEGTTKHIIFVHNSNDHATTFANTYHLEISFVKCPAYDAFEMLETVEAEIRSLVTENNWRNEDVMILVSAGPAAKVLVYDLCTEGYHCIDTGHCWDEPLEGIEL